MPDDQGLTRRDRLIKLRDMQEAQLEVLDDDSRTFATLSKEYRATLAELDSLPEADRGSEVDEVARKREQRRSRAAAAGEA